MKGNFRMWLESLPENCPPHDAVTPNDFLCYRLASHNPPNEDDFFSQRKIYPEKRFHTNECRARALSVFSKKSECEKIKKLPAHREKHIVSLRLFPECGVIKNTGNSGTHFSWWVLSDFLQHLLLEEV